MQYFLEKSSVNLYLLQKTYLPIFVSSLQPIIVQHQTADNGANGQHCDASGLRSPPPSLPRRRPHPRLRLWCAGATRLPALGVGACTHTCALYAERGLACEYLRFIKK